MDATHGRGRAGSQINNAIVTDADTHDKSEFAGGELEPLKH
jgi:hypothetical protein